MDRYLGI